MPLCSIAQNPGKTVNLPVLLLAALCTSSGVIFSTKLEHEQFAYLTILVEILFLYITKLSLIIDIRSKRVTFHSETKNDKPGKFRWNVNISSNWLCHSKICRLFIDKKTLFIKMISKENYLLVETDYLSQPFGDQNT